MTYRLRHEKIAYRVATSTLPRQEKTMACSHSPSIARFIASPVRLFLRNLSKAQVGAVLACCCLVNSALAVPIARYSFGPNVANATPGPDLMGPGITGSDLALFQGNVTSAYGFGTSHLPSGGAYAGTTGGWSGSFSNYFEVVLTAAIGVTFQITEFEAVTGSFGPNGHNQGISFAPNGATPSGATSIWGRAGGSTGFITVNEGTSGWGTPQFNSFSSRTDLTSVAIRFNYSPIDTANAGLVVDHLSLSGNIFGATRVPEPSSLIMLFTGLAGFRMHRRFFRTNL
jgi:hypothetical protein